MNIKSSEDNIQKIGNYKVAEVDYKEISGEILYALEETFAGEVPLLSSDEMKDLAEAYSMEQTDDAIKALGQELTTGAFLLYSIEEDSDSYVLTIIPADTEEAFLKDMKELKRKATRMVQPRKKFGSPAKRIDFGKRLKGTVIDFDSDQYIFKVDGTDDIFYTDGLSGDDGDDGALIVYFDPQPVVIAKCPKLINALRYSDGRYAAVLLNPERESLSSGLTDKTSYIAVGEKLEDISDWKSIAQIEYDKGFVEDIIWFGEDLFLASNYQVYVIRNAMSDAPKVETVFKCESHSLHAGFFVVADTLYLYMDGKIRAWNEGGFLKKAGFNKCIYSSSSDDISEALAINDKELAFTENTSYKDSDGIPMMDVIVLNVHDMKKRKISIPRGWLASVKKGELISLCSGHERVKDKKKFPLMVTVDIESGERKALPYGCLGPDEINSVYKTRDGRLLLHTDERIILPDDPEAFMK